MITKSLYPIVVTKNLEKTLDFYTSILDYSVKHEVTRKDGGKVLVLENSKGLNVEIMTMPNGGPLDSEQGLNGLRMNIEDLDEVVKTITRYGYEIIAGPIETETAKSLIVKDNNGVVITMMEHIKK